MADEPDKEGTLRIILEYRPNYKNPWYHLWDSNQGKEVVFTYIQAKKLGKILTELTKKGE